MFLTEKKYIQDAKIIDFYSERNFENYFIRSAKEVFSNTFEV